MVGEWGTTMTSHSREWWHKAFGVSVVTVLLIAVAVYFFRPSEHVQSVLAVVELGDKYGYIDTAGKVVIEPKYSLGMDFSEGLAAVESDGKWGYLQPDGEYRVPPQFDAASAFSEGLSR